MARHEHWFCSCAVSAANYFILILQRFGSCLKRTGSGSEKALPRQGRHQDLREGRQKVESGEFWGFAYP